MKYNPKGSNPDRGPKMMEGEHHFDKGYESDNETFAPQNVYPGDMQRGNAYFELQNKIVHKDSKKLNSNKFSKIA
jgi:hypothetical protein